MRIAPAPLATSALAGCMLVGCALAYPFSDVAPDDTLPATPAEAGTDSPSGGDDVVVPTNDASSDASVESGDVRWVTVLDQGVADPNDAVWGDVRASPGGGFVVTMSVAADDAGTNTDVALVRLDANGSVMWKKTFGGASNEEGHTAAVDAAGNIWISGASKSDPSLFTQVANPNARRRPYVAKLDANGNLLFAVPIDVSGITDSSCHGIALRAGEAYVGCRFDGTIAVTTTNDDVVQRTSKGTTSDLLFGRVDPANGKLVWNDVYGGDSSDVLWDLLPVGDGHVFATGWFTSSSFSPTNRSRVGTGENAFALELDGTTALPSWIRTWGQAGAGNFVRALSAASGIDGSLVIGGDFRGYFDFGAAGQSTALLRSAWWAFLDRDKQGLEASLVTIAGATSSLVRGIAIANGGDAIATGELQATAPPTVAGHALGYAADGRATGWVVRANESGKVVYTRSWLSGTGAVLPRRVSIGKSGEAVIYGTFTGRVDFGDGIPRTAGTNGSVFVVALEP